MVAAKQTIGPYLRLAASPRIRLTRFGVAQPGSGGGKASTKLPHFKAVNIFLGNLKRSLGGTYHAFDFAKYAHRYLAEAQYRFNRQFNLCSILARLLRAGCLSTPAPAHFIRAAEVGG